MDNMDNMNMTKRKKLVTEPLEDVKATEVPWLVFPYLIKGASTLISGAPGCGKSTFCAALAAALSRGEDLDGNKIPAGPQKVMYLEMEDDPAWEIKPVLVANGVAQGTVEVPKKSQMDGTLTLADPDIVDLAKEKGCTVVILGPLTAFFGGMDMNNATTVKPVLQGFLDRCSEAGIATMMIHHTTKMKAGSDISSPAGSMQIAGTYRLMYNVYAPKNRFSRDSKYRWIVPIKCNVGTKQKPAICAWELLPDADDIPRKMKWSGETGDDLDDVKAGKVTTPVPMPDFMACPVGDNDNADDIMAMLGANAEQLELFKIKKEEKQNGQK